MLGIYHFNIIPTPNYFVVRGFFVYLLLAIKRQLLAKKSLNFKPNLMTKEIRKDLYTASEYARKIGLTPQAVKKKMDNGELKLVIINGAKLIKL